MGGGGRGSVAKKLLTGRKKKKATETVTIFGSHLFEQWYYYLSLSLQHCSDGGHQDQEQLCARRWHQQGRLCTFSISHVSYYSWYYMIHDIFIVGTTLLSKEMLRVCCNIYF